MHWTVHYDEDAHGRFEAIGHKNLYRIRHSDGRWVLSAKAKDRPGPYKVVASPLKLEQAKREAYRMENA